MKRLLSTVYCLLLCLSLAGCSVQLARSDNTFTNVLLWVQRANAGVDAASELAHKLHCPKCQQHGLSADAELALQDRFLLVNDWLTKAFNVIDMARTTSKTLQLTVTTRAALDTYLNGATGALAITGQSGLSSMVSLSLDALLAPVRADLKRLQDKFASVPLLAEIQLTEAEWAAIAQAKAANRDTGEVLARRRQAIQSGDETEAGIR